MCQKRLVALICFVSMFVCPQVRQTNAQVTGSLTQWQKVEVTFAGPTGLSELGGTNPFLDYRLQVAFSSGGKTYNVPGFFDGVDATGNSIWKARFTPDQAGTWNYNANFRTGANVAVDLGASAGTNVSLAGSAGNFSVASRDANAPGFLSKGRLSYTGTHYLQTLGDGKYWIKGGADSPENLLGYSGFDNTPQFRHQYPTHAADWNLGDPNWTNEAANGAGVREGKNLIGAMNYLSSQGVNSIYFLPMNIGGDGKDTSPYSTVVNWNGNATGNLNDNTRFDVSKLNQWETAFSHAQAKGLQLHVVLNEAELNNKHELDDATLGNERKLFYREMVARFGHHNALQWNMCEEYNGFGTAVLTPQTIKDWAAYLSAVDPYDHPLTVHNAGSPLNATTGPWAPFIGDSNFDVTSLQYANQFRNLSDTVENYRLASRNAGRPIPVMIDEPESITRIAIGVNDNTEPGDTLTERFNTVRKEMLYDIYFSGGSVEWFVHDEDQSAENFRRFEQVFRETTIARRFMEDNLPFWLMDPNDDLLRGEDTDYGGGEVFALLGNTYAFYLPDGSNDDNVGVSVDGSPELDLRLYSGSEFQLRWFNPRTGQFVGNSKTMVGGNWAAIGATPDGFGVSGLNDWVGLVKIVNAVPEPGVGLIGALAGLSLVVQRRRLQSELIATVPLA